MKKIFLLLVVTCSFSLAVLAQDQPRPVEEMIPQQTDSLAPYQKYPTLPAFNILEMDSVTIFNTFNIPKGRKTALIFFSPDCGHCRRLMDRITNGMDSLKNVDFYFATAVHNMEEIRKFYKQHHLADYDNIKMAGRDYEFFFGTFYRIHMVPDVVLYDENKKLIKLFEGEVPLSAIYDLVKE